MDAIQLAAYEAVEVYLDPLPSQYAEISDRDVERARKLVADMAVVPAIEAWEAEARLGPGGRARSFPIEALLVAMVLCACQHKPMLLTTFRDVMFRGLSPSARAQLGIPEPPPDNDLAAWRALYRNVRTRFHNMVGLMDPSCLPKNRVMSGPVFEALVASAAAEAGDLGERSNRLAWFCNRVLDASYRCLPRDVRRAWNGSVGLDATKIQAFANAEVRTPTRPKRAWRDRPLRKSSAEPDAGLYVRHGDHDGGQSDAPLKEMTWAFEATLVRMGADNPETDHTPGLIVAMAPLHRPGIDPGGNAIVALGSAHERGLPANWCANDLAYTNARPDNFQLPARALGYKLILDYKDTQLGLQGSFAGMVQVEGQWYCPAIPEALINATRDFRSDKISYETWQERLAARVPYEMRPNGRADANGDRRLIDPASGAAPTMKCDLKPTSLSKARGSQVVPLTHLLRTEAPKVCRQQTVTVPPDAGAKFEQELRFGTPAWQLHYATLRNGIEGGNGQAKDGARGALGDPTRRRVRGVAAQSVFAAFLIFGLNLDLIRSYLERLVTDPDGAKRVERRRRRKHRKLTSYLPGTPALANSPPGPPAS